MEREQCRNLVNGENGGNVCPSEISKEWTPNVATGSVGGVRLMPDCEGRVK